MNGPVAICCREQDAFVRAHTWALSQRRTSLLLPRADWPRLAGMVPEMGPITVISEAADIAGKASNGADAVGMCPDMRFASFECLPVTLLDPVAVPAAFSDDWPGPVAVLMTSGSTGRPRAVTKSPAELAGELKGLCALMPSSAEACDFLCTVPLEHMYGYMFGFWVPRMLETTLLSGRVVLPMSLHAACAAARRPIWLVTTPVHLRAYCECGSDFPNVAGILCATAPLAPELAQRARARFGCEVLEIYGSTETGACAFRRWDSRSVPVWQALPGVRIEADAQGQAICRAPYLPAPVTLQDRIAFIDGGFSLVGRSADLVKVGGKRHSMAALNKALLSVPAVQDGAYFDPSAPDAGLPPHAAGAALANGRLAAFVVIRPGYSERHVLAQLREQIDEVFLPRPLWRVDALPRTQVGKLRQQDLAELWQACTKRADTHEATS